MNDNAPKPAQRDSFLLVRRQGIDLAYEKLHRVGVPDPIGAVGLLVSLVRDAEWREHGRGTLKATVDGLAEQYGGVHHSRVRRLVQWLEAAELVRASWVRGHDGEVLILAWDDLVRVPLRAVARNAPRPGAVATRSDADATRSDAEQPEELSPRTKKEDLKEHESGSDRSCERDPSCGAFTSERDQSLRDGGGRGKSEDALKRRCLDLFEPKGVSRDDCVRAIDQLRCDNIADEIIDTALGQSEKRHAQSLGYLRKVARDFYAQRTA